MNTLSHTTSGGTTAAVIRKILLAAAAAALAATAQGAQPPDTVGSDSGNDTAMGVGALYSLTSGYQNTATGAGALEYNQTGYKNTATGYAALLNNTGSDNAAFGSGALVSNQGAGDNSAFGMDALYSNKLGEANTAAGSHALYSNMGNSNTALGYYSLYGNTTGGENVAIGQNALGSNLSGGNNIAVGAMGGYDITGSNNIDIGSTGASGDTGVIRIGTAPTQTKVFIAGVESSKITGNAVYVTASGQLGVLASAERYKTKIMTMGADQAKLARLRPVTFHLKSDPGGAVQYGLIAEEVDKIYPELVIRDQAGRIQGVRYDELAPLLLNEVQRQRTRMAAQDAAIEAQAGEFRAMKRQVAALARENRAMQATLTRSPVGDPRLAQR